MASPITQGSALGYLPKAPNGAKEESLGCNPRLPDRPKPKTSLKGMQKKIFKGLKIISGLIDA
jgi:hypothetical protein